LVDALEDPPLANPTWRRPAALLVVVDYPSCTRLNCNSSA